MNSYQLQTSSGFTSEQYDSIRRKSRLEEARNIGKRLSRKYGIHSCNAMTTTGFEYTGKGDTARCRSCGLEVAGWRADMIPFIIHSQRSPSCTFVQSMSSFHETILSPKSDSSTTASSISSRGQSFQRVKGDAQDPNIILHAFQEIDLIKQVRIRTFSHWPHSSSPSSSQMIEAGFFNCNVGDRVICIYCNLICQKWVPHLDDPCEVHKTFSSTCPYVVAVLNPVQTSSISIVNDRQRNDHSSDSTDNNRFQYNEIVATTAYHSAYSEIPKRYESFTNWSGENLPSVDNLVKAGFFYTGNKTIVTCFYCNGSLQNWSPNDDPIIEHARWFPNCSHAKVLCGIELHSKIQESNRIQLDGANVNNLSNDLYGRGGLYIANESVLSRLVAARLDLPISRHLLDRNFKLSVIKRCWEDQLRFKREDFVSDCDLLIACIILQKQIEIINGKKENIIIPSLAMREQHEKSRKWQNVD